MTQKGAEDTLNAVGLILGGIAEAWSDTIPEGQVMSQDPAANSEVPEGSAVSITISKGKEKTGIFGCGSIPRGDTPHDDSKSDLLLILLVAAALFSVTCWKEKTG